MSRGTRRSRFCRLVPYPRASMKNRKFDKSCTSNPKSEVSDWTSSVYSFASSAAASVKTARGGDSPI